jgi:sigma-B regulation protein RsbU (phosphoserine phosphatase)
MESPLNIEVFDTITKSQLLIVDDSRENLDALNIILRKENYDVMISDNGNAAMKLLESATPDLILLDIDMPRMSGLELCRRIKQIPKFTDTPVIFITGKSLTDDLVDGFNAGAVDYLVKPFNLKELLVRIKTHLDLKYSRELLLQNSRKIEEYNKELVAINERLIELNAAKDRFLNVLRTDLESAADYVSSLIPEPYENDIMKVSWEYHPSSHLSGDSFGYHWIDDFFVFYLVDVSGHGVKSALQSVSVLNILRSESLRRTDFTKPQQVLQGLDKVFRIKEPDFLYFSIWYGCYSLKSGYLSYAGAGHPPAVLTAE